MSAKAMKLGKVLGAAIFAVACSMSAPGQAKATLMQVVGKAPTTMALKAEPAPNSVGVSTATEVDGNVIGVTGLLPTGTVTYTATDLQGAGVIAVMPLAGGASEWIASALTTGTYAVSAAYSGDENYLPSSAQLSTSVVVSGSPDFSLTMDSVTGTVKQGDTWKGNATLRAINGFSGVVALTCANPETQMTCGFDSASVQLAPSANPVILVKVVTVATTVTTLSGLGLFACFATFGGTKRRRVAKKAVAFMAMAGFAVLVTGCGVNQRYAQTNGTPRGTYKLVITATSGTLVHSQQVQVTVQ